MGEEQLPMYMVSLCIIWKGSKPQMTGRRGWTGTGGQKRRGANGEGTPLGMGSPSSPLTPSQEGTLNDPDETGYHRDPLNSLEHRGETPS